jgi:hypothetical protein
VGGLGHFHMESLGRFQELYLVCGSENPLIAVHTEKKESIRMSSLNFGCEIQYREASTGSCCGVYKIRSMVLQFAFKGVVTVSILLATLINSTNFSRDHLSIPIIMH